MSEYITDKHGTWLVENGKKRGLVSSSKLTKILNSPSIEEEQNRIRKERDKLLNEVLWLVERHDQELKLIDLSELTSTTLANEEYTQLLIYIQALRDVPNNSFIIPSKPEFLN
jgi:hypothetical protein